MATSAPQLSSHAEPHTAEPHTAEPPEGNYFVSTYPPFSCWESGQVSEVARVLEKNAEDGDAALGLYVHVPFCLQRCDYCYYRSYSAPSREQTDGYVEALLAELTIYGKSPALSGRRLDFAYFGGGTPSLLSAEQIGRLLGGIKGVFPWGDAREVSFECAPKTATSRRLAVLKQAGVTRISLGVQQLNDDVLAKNGRIHRAADVERAYSQIGRHGFQTVNLDLMAGMVGETEHSFFASLDRVIAMEPDSVTIYMMEIPPNTPLHRALQDGSLDEPPASWDVKRDRLGQAFSRLEQAGYTVRSAYSAVRDPQRHPFVYQEAQYRGADLLGLGVASFSYLNGVHFQNVASIEPYQSSLADDRLPLSRAYRLSDDEQLVREFVLQLKLGQVDMRALQDKFGVDVKRRFAAPLKSLAAKGWLTVKREQVILTRAGLLRVDRLIPAFYPPRHREQSYW